MKKKIRGVKRYFILASALMMCVVNTGCGLQDGEKQTESGNNSVEISEDNTAKSDADSIDRSEDSTAKSDATEEPVRIKVKDSANKISVSETELSEIAAAEEDEYVRINNVVMNYSFVHPYKDGYFYPVQKSGTDGSDEVYFYKDRQGQLSECIDFPRMPYIVHSFDDSIYYCYYDYDDEEAGVKRWKSGEITNIIDTGYSYERDLTFSENYIYYTDTDLDEGLTYICRTDYEGKEKQQLFALDVYITQIHLYQDAIWFQYIGFGADSDTINIGRLELSSHEIDIYENLEITAQGFYCDNGFVYFSSQDFKRLNIKDNSVETVYKGEVEGVNFVDDSILFFKGKKIYRVNNDGIKNIMTMKNCDGINGINVLDGKIYIETYAGSMHDEICQIDLEGNIATKIYEGETSDELKKKIKNG